MLGKIFYVQDFLKLIFKLNIIPNTNLNRESEGDQRGRRYLREEKQKKKTEEEVCLTRHSTTSIML